MLIGSLTVFTLIASIIVLISALILVKLDFKRRNSRIKDRYMTPLHLNLPNFIFHSFILLIMLSSNIVAEIACFKWAKEEDRRKSE